MDYLRVLYHIIKAGFLERSRRYSFFITLGIIVLIAYKYLPPMDANYLTLCLGNIRGVYNSAWVGAAFAIFSSTLLSVPAFYLVKNSVDRDVQTGVGQIIAATPMSKLMYTVGKMISNFTVLTAMVFAIAFSALVMQMVRGEDFTLSISALLAPFLYSTLPTMAIIAALAIVFETIPFLRGSFGNIVFFFLWIGYNTLFALMKAQSGFETSNDLLGITPIINAIIQSASRTFPDYHDQFVIGMTPVYNGIKTFVWEGVPWTFSMVADRLLWILAAFFIASIAALTFHRFDTAPSVKNKQNSETLVNNLKNSPLLLALNIDIISTVFELLPIKSEFARILSGEFMLMMKGLSKWWNIVLMILNIIALLLPIDTVQRVILPFTGIWPLMILSSMGVREERNRAQGLVFTSPNLMQHQFTAVLLSGMLTAILSSGGIVIRYAAEGMWINILALVVAALFVSALAFFCGVWSRSSKVFEVLYMVIWYIGPINQMEYIDFLGVTGASIGNHMYAYYFIAAIFMIGMALIGRIRQTR